MNTGSFNDINWKKFGVSGQSQNDSFEDLCLQMFCIDLNLSKSPSQYQNHPYIEVDPVENDGKYYSFQAKFFKNKFEWDQIKKSVLGAIEQYPRLDVLYIYSNQDKTKNPKVRKLAAAEEELQKLAEEYSVKLRYITGKSFQFELNQSQYLWLKLFYFSKGDPVGYVRNSINRKIQTFIQSPAFIRLPLNDENNQTIESLDSQTTDGQSEILMVSGQPGSGKTYLLHKLFRELAGFDSESEKKMIEKINQNQALPTIINLKDCFADSLETIIRGRQLDSFFGNDKGLNIIYILDGLDELDTRKADEVLHYVDSLQRKDDTKKIILSCRSGNPNRFKAKEYLPNIREYSIQEITSEEIDFYFSVKLPSKEELLSELKKNNPSLIADIKDILSLSFLWDIIEKLDERHTSLDLIAKKVQSLFDPAQRKNLTRLNLPDPKRQQIYKLNQKISYTFQQNHQYRFNYKDLQSIVCSEFPLLDYNSTNEIIEYISSLFFDTSNSDSSSSQSFIYQHRRLQEFFFVSELGIRYDKDPRVLRSSRILLNDELFQVLFLPYLRKKYKESHNLVGILEINLIQIYLDYYSGWGALDPYYLNSERFFSAIAIQNPSVFNELISNENLLLSKKIKIDIELLKENLGKLSLSPKNYDALRTLEDIWRYGIPGVLRTTRLFWENHKEDFARELIDNVQTAYSLLKEDEAFQGNCKSQQISDPIFSDGWKDWLYYKTVVEKMPINNLLDVLRGDYQDESGQQTRSLKHLTGTLEPLFSICLNNRIRGVIGLLDTLSTDEFSCFLKALGKLHNLHHYFDNPAMVSKISRYTGNNKLIVSKDNMEILFFRRLSGQKISSKHRSLLGQHMQEIRKARPVDVSLHKYYKDFAEYSYAAGEDFYKKDKDLRTKHPQLPYYYSMLGLFSALYSDYINLLLKRIDLKQLVSRYCAYMDSDRREMREHNYIKHDISQLWGYIFSYASDDSASLPMFRKIVAQENYVCLSTVCYILLEHNKEFLTQAVNPHTFSELEKELNDWNKDSNEYIDRFFDLSLLFSAFDSNKSSEYLVRGLNEGILRHGHRKDTIISYGLVKALEILWRNNWRAVPELKKLTKRVFEMTWKVTKVTDGKHTWDGPYGVLEMVAKFDIPLAEQYGKEIISRTDDGVHGMLSFIGKPLALAKITAGYSCSHIYEEVEKYPETYRSQAGDCVSKFMVYCTVANDNFYSDEGREHAFKQAVHQIQKLRASENNWQVFLQDERNKTIKRIYRNLCKRYNHEFDLKSKRRKEDWRNPKSPAPCFRKLERATSSDEIKGIYEGLHSGKYTFRKDKKRHWQLLLNRTQTITGEISLFTDWLGRNQYPGYSNMSEFSGYFHIGIAYALSNINMREEVLNYIYKNSGRESFIHMMKVYETNRDEAMCNKLFDRYIKFCTLLLD